MAMTKTATTYHLIQLSPEPHTNANVLDEINFMYDVRKMLVSLTPTELIQVRSH